MNLETSNIPAFEPKKVDLPDAPFLSFRPDFPKIRHAWRDLGGFKNILVIGNGGSVNSFIGMVSALGTDKRVVLLSTTDPEYIADLKKTMARHETLVITISKSGENTTQIESTMHFIEYPLLFIAGKDSPLEQVGEKLGAKIVPHPDIGGRFDAFTEAALIPAAICGIDIAKVYEGSKQLYAAYREDNIAMQAAQIFYRLERQGISEVFIPFYSHYLFSFGPLITQLCHESFGKDGKGQSYLTYEAPEWQHHTLQRFFGGPKNVAGFFINLNNFRTDQPTVIPTGLQGIAVRDGSLFDLNKITLAHSMQSEFHGTYEDAKIRGIPVVVLHLSAIQPEQIGAFIAFWQLFAVYSGALRGVNPFDQPQVENSKTLSWRRRKNSQ